MYNRKYCYSIAIMAYSVVMLPMLWAILVHTNMKPWSIKFVMAVPAALTLIGAEVLSWKYGRIILSIIPKSVKVMFDAIGWVMDNVIWPIFKWAAIASLFCGFIFLLSLLTPLQLIAFLLIIIIFILVRK